MRNLINLPDVARALRDFGLIAERHLPLSAPRVISTAKNGHQHRPFQLASFGSSEVGRTLAREQKYAYAEFGEQRSRFQRTTKNHNVEDIYRSAELWINVPDEHANSIVLAGAPVISEDSDLIRFLSNSSLIRSKLWVSQVRKILMDRHFHKAEEAPLISVICSTNRPHQLHHLRKQFYQQNYPNLELQILCHGFKEEGCLFAPSDATLGECLNTLIKASRGEIIAKFDDDDFYLPNYLSDQYLWLLESNADIVGKSANYIYFKDSQALAIRRPFESNKFTHFVTGATLMGSKTCFEELGFTSVNQGEDSDFLRRAKDKRKIIYSTDPFNFIISRHGSHTWDESDSALKRGSRVETFGLNFPHVTV